MRRKPRDRRTRHYTMNLRLEPGEQGTVHGLSALLAVAMLKSDGSQVVHPAPGGTGTCSRSKTARGGCRAGF